MGINNWKKILPLMVLCIFSFCAVCLAQLGVITDDDSYTNLRSGPGASYSVVGSAHYGDLVNISENADGWCRIYNLRGGGSGWCSGNPIGYVNTLNGQGMINADDSNLRAAPTSSSRWVGVLYRGSPVRIRGSYNGWYYVESSSLPGAWIYAGYVNL